MLAVEGIIGAGKTTLARRLAEDLNLRPLYEAVEDNPFLEHFYQDQEKWAAHMQFYLLHRRRAQQQAAAWEAKNVSEFNGAVLDRSLPGDRVFAKMHLKYGNIHELVWQSYEFAFDVMTHDLTPPTLILFLDVDPETAMERVKKRSRGAESGLTLEYLRDLRKGYLDLLTEIESGQHSWAQGLAIHRVPWNVDHQDVTPLVDMVRSRYRL